MNLRKEDVKKPWEKITIEEIQPYPPKYTKIIILSYAFILFNFFEFYNFFNIDTNILLPFTTCVYGVLIFVLLYLYSNGRLKSFLFNLKDMAIVVTAYVIFVNFILIGTGHITMNTILRSLRGIFVLLLLFSGPIYLTISHHPRSEKHGYILIAIFIIYMSFSLVILAYNFF